MHDVDFVYHLFGLPKAVSSRGYSKDTGEIDHVSTQYLYDGGPTLVTAEGAWGMADGFGFRMQFNVNFDRATAEFEFGRETPLVVYADGKTQKIEPTHNGYVGEMRYLVGCIGKGERPTRVTAEDAVTGLRIIEAERQSALTGQRVEL